MLSTVYWPDNILYPGHLQLASVYRKSENCELLFALSANSLLTTNVQLMYRQSQLMIFDTLTQDILPLFIK